tara:strand:- start:154 stop:267 length:114 start_codon:yes stop_codon:yes gene_type:complete
MWNTKSDDQNRMIYGFIETKIEKSLGNLRAEALIFIR